MPPVGARSSPLALGGVLFRHVDSIYNSSSLLHAADAGIMTSLTHEHHGTTPTFLGTLLGYPSGSMSKEPGGF